MAGVGGGRKRDSNSSLVGQEVQPPLRVGVQSGNDVPVKDSSWGAVEGGGGVTL